MFKYIYPKTISKNLAADAIPERTQFLIMGLTIFFQYVIGRLSLIDALKSSAGRFNFIIIISGGIITFLVAYLANGSNKGKNFIQRYVILASILYFWINLFGYAAYLGAYYTAYFFIQKSQFYAIFKPHGIATTIYNLIFYALYIWLIAKYLTEIRNQSTQNSNNPTV